MKSFLKDTKISAFKQVAACLNLCYISLMAGKLQDLASEYLSWQNQREKADEKLNKIKNQIILMAEAGKIKKIKSGKNQLLIISQSETRCPQQGEPGRGQLEKIVHQSGEAEKAFSFDIIRLGNAYDEKRLTKKLMARLKPFARREKTTKIVVKKASV